MTALTRSFALGALLFLALCGLQPGGVAAQDVITLATPAALRIDADHHATTDAIFASGERIAFWYNLLDGGARNFIVDGTGTVYAQGDGTLSVTITADDWNNIPLSASSIVAYGTTSRAAAVYLFTLPPDLDLTMHIDSNHRATTAPLFTINEQVVFWYNLPDGSAAQFYSNPDENTLVTIRPNGALDFTFSAAVWARIPSDATSLVARGLFSGVTVVYIFPR